MPVVLVGSDMISDGGVLVKMWPYTRIATVFARESPGDKAATNSTDTTANISSTDLERKLAGTQGGNGTVGGSRAEGGDCYFRHYTCHFILGVKRHSPLFNWQLAPVKLVVDSTDERAYNSDDGVEGA